MFKLKCQPVLEVLGCHDRIRQPRSRPLALNDAGAVCTGQVGSSLRYILGCFYNRGVLFAGVLIASALLLAVYVRAPDFGKLPLGYLRGMSGCPGFSTA